MLDGTSDAYDGALYLSGFGSPGTATTEDGGREIVMGPYDMGGGISVTRKIYVPATGDGFCRWLEIVTNTGATATNFALILNSYMGSDSATTVVASSSGDTVMDATDRYFITDDADGIYDPTLVHMFYGQAGTAPTSLTQGASDAWTVSYNLSLNAGETKVIMHLEAQCPDRATAQTRATWLDSQPNEIFAGMSTTELSQLVNFVSTVTSSVTATLGPTDRALTLTGTDNINGTGNALDNLITGNSGNNQLSGLDGNDTLIGGDGNDTLIGGNGTDAASYAGATAGVVVNLGLTTAQNTVGAGTDSLSGIENLIGGSGGDTLTGNSGANVISGGDGADSIYGAEGDDLLSGEAGNDSLTGGAGNDTLDGGDGNDVLTDGVGANSISGGAGNDTITASSGNDTITGGAGNDFINGGAGTDLAMFSGSSGSYTFNVLANGQITVTGTDGADTLSGIEQVQFGTNTPVDIATLLPTVLYLSAAQAVLDEGTNVAPTPFIFTVTRVGNTTGESTVNWAVTGTGAKPADAADFDGGALPSGTVTFAAGETSKNIIVNVATDSTAELSETFTVTLTGPSGATLGVDNASSVIKNDDSFLQTDLDDTWTGRNDEDDIASGLACDDTLFGLAGNDTLYGNTGDDSLSGGSGRDSLMGGMGDDTLVGGSGNDVLSGDGGDTGTQQTVSNTTTIPSTAQSLSINLTMPDSASSGSITATGLVSRTAVTSNDYNIAYVIDVSGSMATTFAGATVGDVNGDGSSNTRLDSAIASFNALTASLVGANLGSSKVCLISFDSYGNTVYTGTLSADANTNGIRDVQDSLITLRSGSNTNYQVGLDLAAQFFNAQTSGKNYVFFISDGFPNEGSYPASVQTLLNPSGIDATIKCIGLGTDSSLTDLDLVDDATANSSAQQITDPATLTAGLVASPITQSEIDHVEIWVNGAFYQSIPSSNLVSTPFGLQYTVDISGLPDGTSNVVAKVVATDPASTSVSVNENVSIGGGGDDKLYGGDGNDVLLGDKGDDLMDGGQGIDVADYSAQQGDLAVNLSILTAQNTVSAGMDQLRSIEVLYGGSGNDSLTGDGGGNTLNGNAGNDLLQGLDGDDSLNGGGGNDTLYGGAGNDTLNGFSGNDVMDGGDGIDTANYSWAVAAVSVNLSLTGPQATGGPGTDTLLNIENVLGGAGNDTLVGDAGNNVLTGNAGNDSLSGGAGDDTLEGGAGNDTINGGAGNDAVSYASATAAVTVNLSLTAAQNTGGAGTDTLSNLPNAIGSAFGDTLTGTTGANQLFGGAGNDSLSGGDGNDTLQGGAGNDTLVGGNGTDTADYSDTAAGVTVSLALAVAQNTGGAGTDQLAGIENLVGTAFGDTLTGNTGNNVLEGGLGSDYLNGGAGIDTASYAHASSAVTVSLIPAAGAGEAYGDSLVAIENLLGSNYNDSLGGNASANVLTGGAGNDTLAGMGGADTLDGGDGDDKLFGYAAGEYFIGGAGRDTVSYAAATVAVTANLNNPATNTGWALNDSYSGIENLEGGGYNDSLTGTGAANSIFGAAGNDTISGLGGTDTIEGGDGNDLMLSNAQGELFNGGAGTDTVSYALATAGVRAYLGGGGQNTGFAAGDQFTAVENLAGSGYDDTLHGSSGANSLSGGAGNDLLAGGLGQDSLDGGAGTDTVWFGDASAAVSVNLGLATSQNTLAAGWKIITTVENVVGSAFADTLTGNAGDNVLNGGAGADSLVGGGGTDTVSYADATAGAYVLLAGGVNGGSATGDTYNGIENVIGSAFNDSLYGSSIANKIEGGAGDDFISDAEGNDTIDGGAGVDTLSFWGIAQDFRVDLAVTTAQNILSGTDVITNIENVFGSGGDDTFLGNAADNIIRGGNGADSLDGRAGIDTVSYADANNAVTVSLAITTAQNTGTYSGVDTLLNFENLIGSAYNDTLTGNAGDNVITGGAGADSINGGAGTDTASYANATSAVTVRLAGGTNAGEALGDTFNSIENVIGSAFNDNLFGTAGDNLIQGGVGDDTLSGMAGADTLDGGLGNDAASYASATAGVIAYLDGSMTGAGDAAGDVFIGIENLLGSAYSDVLAGDNRANSLQGWIGDDLLIGGGGNDTLNGGAGYNIDLGGAGNDQMAASSGDMAFGGSGNDIFIPGVGAVVMAGGTGADTLNAGVGAKVLLYNQGDGADVVNCTDSVQDDTLSLGGGITRAGLSLSRVGNDLVLSAGGSDNITLSGWYADSPQQGMLSLQLIEQAAADYNSGSSDPLQNSGVLIFDFAAVVADFNAATYLDPSITSWSMAASLASHLLQATNSAAIGGDFATEYGLNGNFAAIGVAGALAIQSDAGYCNSAQNLQDSSTLAGGGTKLVG